MPAILADKPITAAKGTSPLGFGDPNSTATTMPVSPSLNAEGTGFAAQADTTGTDVTTINDNTPGTNGFSSSFLASSDAALTELNKANAARIEATRKTGAQGIETSHQITEEEIRQNEAEGNRQISYAQERLGGEIVLKRNIDDFTANTTKFHAEISRSLERLEIEKNTALAANDNNAYNALNARTEKMINQQLSMWDRASDVYYKNANLALAKQKEANDQLDTMLQYASLTSASDETLQTIATKTGWDVATLKGVVAGAQREKNIRDAKTSTVVMPAAMVPWQDVIDNALIGTADTQPVTAGQAVINAISAADTVGVTLSGQERAWLSTYAQEQYALKAAADKAAADAASVKKTETKSSGGSTPQSAAWGALGSGIKQTGRNTAEAGDILLEGLTRTLLGK